MTWKIAICARTILEKITQYVKTAKKLEKNKERNGEKTVAIQLLEK